MESRLWRAILIVTGMTALALIIQILSMCFPEWTIQNANAGIELNAHLGLFQIRYNVGGIKDEEDYTFCKGISGNYSTGRCWALRIAQIGALVSAGLAHTSFILLVLVIAALIRPAIMEKVISSVWILQMASGMGALTSAAAWATLMISMSQQHKQKRDGYTVAPGLSLYAMAGVGSFYMTSSFWRMTIYRCWALRHFKERPRTPTRLAVVPEDEDYEDGLVIPAQ